MRVSEKEGKVTTAEVTGKQVLFQLFFHVSSWVFFLVAGLRMCEGRSRYPSHGWSVRWHALLQVDFLHARGLFVENYNLSTLVTLGATLAAGLITSGLVQLLFPVFILWCLN